MAPTRSTWSRCALRYRTISAYGSESANVIARGNALRNGHVGQHAGEARDESGDRQADAAALAAAGHRDPGRVDRVQAPGRLDRADRVGEDAPVVVGRGIQDALGHEPGVERAAGGVGVGRVADRPRGTLAARVHHQVGVSGGGVQDPLVRQAASTAVPEVLDDRGEPPGATCRQVEPCPDAGSTEPGVRDVERVDDRQAAVDRRAGHRKLVASRVGQRLGPEGVEIGRDGKVGRVGAQLLDRQVGLGQDRTPLG